MEINFICKYFCCRIIHYWAFKGYMTIHVLLYNVVMKTLLCKLDTVLQLLEVSIFNMTKPTACTYLCRKLCNGYAQPIQTRVSVKASGLTSNQFPTFLKSSLNFKYCITFFTKHCIHSVLVLIATQLNESKLIRKLQTM